MSTDMSEQQASQLLENRVEFKIYAAEHHLKNLKTLEQRGSTMQSSKERLLWEIEIECFLFHIVGVSDALLHKINDKLTLNKKRIKISDISKKLAKLNERGLLAHLENLHHNNEFCILRDLRNQCTHRKLINVLFRVGSDKAAVSFIVSPKTKLELTTHLLKDIDEEFKNIDDRLEIIPFLDEGLATVKNLVQCIMDNESRLR
jgi:hypothetical protein